jgi:hypothetical protein
MITFVRSFNPVWSFVDLTGKQCDDTFYLWVLENQIPYIPAPVYHTPTDTPWNEPIQLLANGTLPIDVYWDPTIVYRLELRQAVGTNPPSQSDPLIYLIENYIPNGAGSTPVTVDDTLTENQITNGQFSIINFPSPYTLTAATNPDPIQVAPGWSLVLAGTGNVTLTQVPLNSATSNPTNAPYALEITLSGGWTSSFLRQRFQQNGMLWANKYVSSSITARITGASQMIKETLVDSEGNPLALLAMPLLTNDFVEYTGFALLPPTVNTDVPPAAYIDFQIILPPVSDIFLTSVQLVASNTAAAFAYEQDTIDRQIDHTFHYYFPQLAYKPIPSYLVGWDFALNPMQFGTAVGPVATGNNKSFYAWDQTIVFQSVTNGVTVNQAASGGIQLTAAAATQMAIVQYLDAEQAREILSGFSSVAISGYCSGLAQTATVSLWATNAANLPNVATGTNNSIVATLGANGNVATLNGAGWVPLERNNPGDVQLTLSPTSTQFNFSGWLDNAATPRVDNATFFAIVIGLNTVAMGATVTFDWVSLNAGGIATRPAPQAVDEVLRECERFYEMSYTNFAAVGTATLVNAETTLMVSSSPNPGQGNPGNSYLYVSPFGIKYRTVKRSINAVVTLYSPATGTVSTVGSISNASATTTYELLVATYWTAITSGDKYINFEAPSAATIAAGGVLATNLNSPARFYINYHYIVDARLGIVN